MSQFKTIVIDPPWAGPGACPTFDRAKAVVPIPYVTMTGIQIASLRVGEMASDDAQLFLWATTRSLGDAYLLLGAWRFSYRGLFVWKKRLGMGRHMRHELEFLLWAGRPGARLVEPKKCPRQMHEWPRPKRHGEKPPEAYAMIKDLSDGPRLDIFARQERPGFEPWGNQVTKS